MLFVTCILCSIVFIVLVYYKNKCVKRLDELTHTENHWDFIDTFKRLNKIENFIIIVSCLSLVNGLAIFVEYVL